MAGAKWLLVVAVMMIAAPASADEAPGELTWKTEWPTFRPAEYALTGAAGAASVVVYLTLKEPSQPRWTGGVLFDDAARDALRLRSPGARDTIRNVSDITTVSSVVLAVALDSIVVPLARRKASVALQLVLMDAESYALSTLLTTTMFQSLGRARPSYADCQRDPTFDPLCNTAPTASFPSGHSNVAFTAAGLSCAHHAYLRLYGDAVADAFACAGMVTLAAATATFRVMGDRHYASDVLVGSAIGFGFGFGVPTLLHYGMHERAAAASLTISPMGGQSEVGLLASGTF